MARDQQERQAEPSPAVLLPVALILIAGSVAILWVWASHREVWENRPAASAPPATSAVPTRPPDGAASRSVTKPKRAAPRGTTGSREGSESSDDRAKPQEYENQAGEADRTAAHTPPPVGPPDEGAGRLPSAPGAVSVPPKTTAVDDRPGGAATGRWRHGPAAASARLFLFDHVDAAGTRRYHGPAPLGQRYVIVSMSLRWDGIEGQSLVTGTETLEPPAVRLTHGQRRLDPLGRLEDCPDPLHVLSTASMTVPPGDTVDVNLVFLVPEAADAVSLVVGGRTGETLSLPPVPSVDLNSLKGRWRKSPDQLRPVRFADPLVNAIADPDCGLALISRNREGFVQLSLPAASIVSSPLKEQAAVGSALSMTLSQGSDTMTASLRVVEDGDSFLLYTPVDHAVFLFERVQD